MARPVIFFGDGCTVSCSDADKLVVVTPKMKAGKVEARVLVDGHTWTTQEGKTAFEFKNDAAGDMQDVFPTTVSPGSILTLEGTNWGDRLDSWEQVWLGPWYNSTPCNPGNLNYKPWDPTDPTIKASPKRRSR